ncbi:MAG: hypothetical protein IKW96_00760 [Ruminococcus sp.]|uniref:hypothetical protein n=1 Tax=Ruminococcus sp. TaxID=41978 RepID=UPI0025FE8F5A|nr:hypothetical protein [Ruminococcus sp.]MBR5681794.1 hypothetical protein [Ruminococcus sp.]
MKKLTLTAVRTFIIASTICIIPLTALTLYEVFRDKTLLTPMINTPFMLTTILSSAIVVLDYCMDKHKTKELTSID